MPFYRSARQAAPQAQPTGQTFTIPMGPNRVQGALWCASLPATRPQGAPIPVGIVPAGAKLPGGTCPQSAAFGCYGGLAGVSVSFPSPVDWLEK